MRLAEALTDELLSCEQEALGEPGPSWLLRLVAVLDVARATVITFNYDTLLEAAVLSHLITDWTTGERILPNDVIDHLPPTREWTHMPDATESFELLKLHGSLNWWWSPGDTTAATLGRMRSTSAFGSPSPHDDAARRRLFPGRARFIVPPTATKSAYYTNPITRELWQRAGTSLSTARTVWFVGYSLPLTDLLVSGMLAERVERRADLVIVNPEAAAVQSSLAELSFEPTRIGRLYGMSCVADFVDEFEARASRAVLDRLAATQQPERPMCVAWSPNRAAVVVGARRAVDVLLLRTEAANGPAEYAFRSRQHEDSPFSLTQGVGDTLEGLASVRAEFPDGSTTALIDVQTIHRDVGHAPARVCKASRGAPSPIHPRVASASALLAAARRPHTLIIRIRPNDRS